VAPEEQRTSDFATRMSFALEKQPGEDQRRTHVTLKVVMVTLAWLVVVPLMVVFGLTGKQPGGNVLTLAAVTNLVLPFTAAVIATRNKRSGVAGFYIMLTLLMILPSLAINHAG
jgi:hypothetical protein